MDWWLIPVGIVVAVLLRFVWVAAFQPDERVSAVPELDGYVPAERSHSGATGATAENVSRARPSVVEPSDEAGQATVPAPEPTDDGEAVGSVSAVDTGTTPDADAADDGGIWIEIDIEPLFPSSESRQILDLTEAEDPEVTP